MENIQAMMKELFGNSCQAYCYAYIAFKQRNNVSDPDIKYLTRKVLSGWNAGYIDDDGYVSKPVLYFNHVCEGNQIRDIRKVPLTNLGELPETGMFSVEFKLTRDAKASHFAVCVRSKIIFDPSGESNTCKYGVPVSYRKFVPCSSDKELL